MAITAIDAGDWCSCGLATNDPMHDGWHRIVEWNEGVFRDARQKAMDEFEKRVNPQPKQKSKKRERSKNWVPLPE